MLDLKFLGPPMSKRATKVNGRMDRQTDGRTDGRTDRRMDGRTDGRTPLMVYTPRALRPLVSKAKNGHISFITGWIFKI